MRNLMEIFREPEDYEARVEALEKAGLTRSDAQGVVDAEEMEKVRRGD